MTLPQAAQDERENQREHPRDMTGKHECMRGESACTTRQLIPALQSWAAKTLLTQRSLLSVLALHACQAGLSLQPVSAVGALHAGRPRLHER